MADDAPKTEIAVIFRQPLAARPGEQRILGAVGGGLAIARWSGSGPAALEVAFDEADGIRLARLVMAGEERAITEPGAARKLAGTVLYMAAALKHAGLLEETAPAHAGSHGEPHGEAQDPEHRA